MRVPPNVPAADATSTAVVYVRVSTRGQRYRHQLREVRRACAARGWRIVAVCRDRKSGKRGTSRPGWDRARSLMRRRRARVLVAWSLDRLGRSALEVLQAVQDVGEVGGAVHLVKDGLDTSGAAGRLVVTVLAGVAELERELIADRTRAGLAGAAASGRHPGRPRRGVREAAVRRILDGQSTAEAEAGASGVKLETVRGWVRAAVA